VSVTYGLSVTKCSNVLRTSYDTKQIKEYTTQGNLIREIGLDSSIDGPLHCIQLSTCNFVIIHWGDEDRVCIVDTSGHIMDHGGSRGTGVGQLNYPYELPTELNYPLNHLAVDGHDNVLVTDSDNNRVKLLSPTLTRSSR